MKLTSTAFTDGQPIPVKHTCLGADVSPALKWTDVPAGAKSLALICDDPDAPAGTWVHWVLWGLPPSATELPEKVPTSETLPNGAKQGLNDFRRIGYGGPSPPANLTATSSSSTRWIPISRSSPAPPNQTLKPRWQATSWRKRSCWARTSAGEPPGRALATPSAAPRGGTATNQARRC